MKTECTQDKGPVWYTSDISDKDRGRPVLSQDGTSNNLYILADYGTTSLKPQLWRITLKINSNKCNGIIQGEVDKLTKSSDTKK